MALRRSLNFLPNRKQALGACLLKSAVEQAAVDLKERGVLVVEGESRTESSSAWQALMVMIGLLAQGIHHRGARTLEHEVGPLPCAAQAALETLDGGPTMQPSGRNKQGSCNTRWLSSAKVPLPVLRASAVLAMTKVGPRLVDGAAVRDPDGSRAAVNRDREPNRPCQSQ